MPSKDWDWNDPTRVALPAVAAVAVYTNQQGEIVIRQQSLYGEEDSVIIVPRKSISALVKALRAEAAKPIDG